MLGVCSNFGCHFLVLCSIIEEYNQKNLDLIDAIRTSMSKGWVRPDFYVVDAIAFLNAYTGKKWSRRSEKTLPTEIKSNEYTEIMWVNGNYTHFTRRSLDTLINSNTVKNGKISQYYIYTVV